MNCSEDARERIDRYCAAVGLQLDPRQLDAIVRHLEIVLDRRSSLNLIAESTARDAARIHVLDSLAAVPALTGCRRLIDIGSGAGFPGIPLGVALGCEFVLIESRGKRARFLEDVVEALGSAGANGTVVNARAESPEALAASTPSDAVVARAVAQLPVLLELASPYLSIGGRFVALKGDVGGDELERGDLAATIVGMERTGLSEYALHDGAERRALVSYTRVAEPEINLPRREGRASKSPIA